MNESLNESVTALATSSDLFGTTLPLTGNPALDIFCISLLGALFVTLVNKYLSDQIKIKALRAEMKELQKKMRKQMSKNPEKAKQMQQEIFKKNLENMKHAFNPKIMLITMLPMLLLFFFIRSHYGGFGEFLDLGFTQFGWLGTYIVFSIINSIALKKILDVA
jgi:uncharacterized membrane protein (DUF106 family)